MLMIEKLKVIAPNSKGGTELVIYNLLFKSNNLFRLEEELKKKYVFETQEIIIRGIRYDEVSDEGLALALKGNVG